MGVQNTFFWDCLAGGGANTVQSNYCTVLPSTNANRTQRGGLQSSKECPIELGDPGDCYSIASRNPTPLGPSSEVTCGSHPTILPCPARPWALHLIAGVAGRVQGPRSSASLGTVC